MKKLLFTAVFLLASFSAYSQNIIPNGPVGRDFWLAVPPNDPNNGGYWNIEFYVASEFNTVVTVENPGTGMKLSKPVTANSTAIFTLGPEAEVQKSEVVTDQGYHIYSKAPISVYVLNTRPTTSDGFMAIPTNVLGKEYIHVAHYEFNDFGSEPRFGTGFVITATEDGTKVRFLLKGKGNPKTAKNGWGLGTQHEVLLDKGQTYMLRTAGNTSNVNDITGTSISSTKPVSVVSFHMRANLPSGVITGSRDCLSEMIPPVHSWGKRFVTMPFATDSDKGDLFRVVASQNGTEVVARVYDKSGKLTKVKQATLDKGQFVEWDNPSTIDQAQSINGPAYWEASKPVQIMQYSMSQTYYSNGYYDPDMVIVPSIDQYGKSTVFQTPPGERFTTNWFYLYAIGDSTDQNYTKLKTIRLDSNPVWKNFPNLLFNRIPGTNVYWVYIKVTPGPHYIESDTEFGGIINGFSSVDGYSWPAAMTLNKIDALDTLSPVIAKAGGCGNWTIYAAEERSFGNDSMTTTQVDQGIAAIEILDSVNYKSYTIKNPAKVNLSVSSRTRNVEFTFEPRDRSKPGMVIYYVLDAVGNIAMDSLRYTPGEFSVSATQLNFGKVDAGGQKQLQLTLTNNNSEETLQIKRIFAGSTEFVVSSPGEQSVAPKQSATITVTFVPGGIDIVNDTLFIETACGTIAVDLKGRSENASYSAGNLDFGPRELGATHIGSAKVVNSGTVSSVTIDSVRKPGSPFIVNVVGLPATLTPGMELEFEVLFKPQQTGEFSDSVSFHIKEMDEWITSELRGSVIIASVGEEDAAVSVDVSGQMLRVYMPGMNGAELNCSIYSMTGESLFERRLVMAGESSETAMPRLAPGVYYARLSTGQNSIVRKFIIVP